MSSPHLAMFLRDLSGGGAERVMLNLAGALAAMGCGVELVLAHRVGAYVDEVPADVKVVDLGAGRLMHAVVPLSRYLRRRRPAAVLSTLVHTNLAAVLASRMARVPTPLVLREANRINAHQKVPRWTALAYRRADHVIAPSKGVADDLATQYRLDRQRIEVIYNPVDLSVIDARAAEMPEEPWFAAGQPPVLVTAGRLIEQKDHITLLKAFARVRQQRVVRLIILGDGPLRDSLRALADSLGVGADVSLPGFASNPYAYMARAGAFVLSSRWEGCSNVLIEAMACGTPVVATDCPHSPREILEEGRLGPLAPVGDEAALAAAIVKVLEEPPQPSALRKRAAGFSVQGVAHRYRQVLLG